MYQITLDYNNAVTQAENLEQVAKNIEKMINNEFSPCMNDISRNWTGDNANAYIAKGNKLKNEMQNSADELRKAAKTIRQIAGNTYRAEKAAYDVAKKRSYNK